MEIGGVEERQNDLLVDVRALHELFKVPPSDQEELAARWLELEEEVDVAEALVQDHLDSVIDDVAKVQISSSTHSVSLDSDDDVIVVRAKNSEIVEAFKPLLLLESTRSLPSPIHRLICKLEREITIERNKAKRKATIMNDYFKPVGAPKKARSSIPRSRKTNSF